MMKLYQLMLAILGFSVLFIIGVDYKEVVDLIDCDDRYRKVFEFVFGSTGVFDLPRTYLR